MRAHLGFALAIALLAGNAAAQDDGVALAEPLFESGVQKMESAHCDTPPITDVATCTAAREDFRRAYELHPGGLGALRNLAFVEKGLGLVASSARHFRELARKAPLDPKPARRLWAEFAKTELTALEPRIPHLLVKVSVDDATLKLDGAVLPRAVWGTPVEVDPGEHALHAEAPLRRPFDRTVTVGEGDAITIDVDFAKPVEAEPAPKKVDLGPPKQPSKLGPLIVTGAGVVSIGVGLGLGWAAIHKHGQVCSNGTCDPQGYESGKSLARASTIVTGIGLAAAASGVVWYVLSSKHEEPRTAVVPYVGPTLAGIELTRRF